jgi:hypothetical protein
MATCRSVICFAIVLLVLPALTWAQTDQSSEAGKPSTPGKPKVLEQGIRFDDADRSGTPCAVPGTCGRCDCPKLPPSTDPAQDPKRGSQSSK